MFIVLKKHGIETVMVRYKDDGHSIRRNPINLLDAMRGIIAWFDKHAKGTTSSM